MATAVVVFSLRASGVVSAGCSFWRSYNHQSRLISIVSLQLWPLAFICHNRERRGKKQRKPAAARLAGTAVLLAWMLSIAGNREKGQ